MQTLWKDLRYALRMLAKSPGFATVATLTLALGIGANAAIFQLIDAVRLRTLPVQDPGTLAIVHLNKNSWGSGNFTGPYSEFTFPLWQEVQKRQQAFSSVAAWGGTQLNLAKGGEVDNAQAIWISGQFFQVLGVQPILGRLISSADDPEDEQAGCSGAVDLSYAFWQRRYGGDASVIGKALTLECHPFPIVGVTPSNFFGVSVGDRFDLGRADLCGTSDQRPIQFHQRPSAARDLVAGAPRPPQARLDARSCARATRVVCTRSVAGYCSSAIRLGRREALSGI